MAKLHLEWGDGFSDMMINSRSGEAYHVESEHEDINGLRLYYQSRTGLSGAGWLEMDRPLQWIKAGCWRTDVSNVAPREHKMSDPVTFLGWEIYYPVESHVGIDSDFPVILKLGRGIVFLHVDEAYDFIYMWYKEGKDNEWDSGLEKTWREMGAKEIILKAGWCQHSVFLYNPNNMRGPSIELLYPDEAYKWAFEPEHELSKLGKRLKLMVDASGDYHSMGIHGFATHNWGRKPDHWSLLVEKAELPFDGWYDGKRICFSTPEGLIEVYTGDNEDALIHPRDF